MDERLIQWHMGFTAAVDLELEENREDLEYAKEYSLNSRPLQADLLVIRKNRGKPVANEIGRLFRGHNIMEYKSPRDELDVDAFYKAGAYAALYKSYGKCSDERKADDITVSLVRHARPEGLFEYFSGRGVKVSRPYKGIYYIEGCVLFPTQVIVGKELDRKAHVWLRALSGGLGREEIKELLEKAEGLGKKQERELAGSVLEVSLRANWEMIQELRGDEDMCQALMEIMEPEISKIRQEIREKTREADAREFEKIREADAREFEKIREKEARKLISCAVESFRDMGIGDERIRETIMKNYRLTEKEAAEYLG